MTGSADREPRRSHLLAYACVPLLILAGILSYHRFIVSYDYLVEYEGECDPAVESCYVGCEDETCAEVYYYTNVTKHAADLYAACGPDITDCTEASICLPNDRVCEVAYCDPEEAADESCARIEASDDTPEAEEELSEEPETEIL